MSVEEMLEKLVVSLDRNDVGSCKEAFDKINGLEKWMSFRCSPERKGMISQDFIENLRKNGPMYG